jgi:hypothetical protein
MYYLAVSSSVSPPDASLNPGVGPMSCRGNRRGCSTYNKLRASTLISLERPASGARGGGRSQRSTHHRVKQRSPINHPFILQNRPSSGHATLLSTMTFPAHDCAYSIQTSCSPASTYPVGSQYLNPSTSPRRRRRLSGFGVKLMRSRQV